MIKNQNFGVEIEFGGLSRRRACAIVADVIGGGIPCEIGRGWQTVTPDARTWKIVRDVSVSPQGGDDCELVTPILRYADIELLQEVIRALRRAGAKVDETCGIHIHVDKANFTARTLRNLVNIVSCKEPLMYNAIGVLLRRQDRYCKPVDRDFLAKMNSQKPADLESVGALWYGGVGALDRARYQHYNETRYHGLNLHNVWYAHTVEFRYFNSTLHAGKVKAYIQFVLAVSAQALTQRCASTVPTVTTNPKYTFRTWLLRLGLIGKEFETCRQHLLQALPGDIAFRNGRPA